MTTYRGVICHQTGNFRQILTPVLREIEPEVVVELGTSYGGTTLYLLDVLPRARVVTFEIDGSKINEHLRWYKNCSVCVQNIWTRGNFSQAIRHYLTVPRKKLVLVDGGDKIKEFSKAAPLLRTGDYIAAHDFCISKEVYASHYAETVWHWLEITHADISEVCVKHNLVPVFPETHQAMWGFYRKAI